MCREIAPQIFKRHDDGAYSYVYRQPVTQEQIALAEEALSHCPTETIGNNGTEPYLERSGSAQIKAKCPVWAAQVQNCRQAYFGNFAKAIP